MEFLDLAAELAEKVDWRDVYPNPRVGCVVVQNGNVVATGVHEKVGGAHAEVNALENVETGLEDKTGLEIYITLEPCDHFPGKKTGSCTDALLHIKPKKVIIGAIDSRFGGKNVEKLRAAGIEVEVKEHERSKALSRTKRTKPYVILKMAQTLDGKIDQSSIFNLQSSNGKLQMGNQNNGYISSLESRKRVHQWRSEVDGILTTTKTILADDPLLDCRLVNKNIVRNLFVFGESSLSQESKIFQFPDRKIVRFDGKNLGRDLREISEMGVRTLLTECGAAMATSLLRENLVNEIRLFVAPKIFGKGIGVFADEVDLKKFDMTEIEEVGGDVLISFQKTI